MSSPRNRTVNDVREGNRVVLREITATLHNSSSPVQTFRRKSETPKAAEHHEVKVQFAREFADVESITSPAQHAVSSANSVHSIASTKGSSVSSYSTPSIGSPLNHSYANSNISGLDDLIQGCAGLQLNDDDCSLDSSQKFADLTIYQDETFASATDEPELDTSIKPPESSVKEIIKNDSIRSPNDSIEDVEERPTARGTPPAVLASPGRRCSFIKLEIKLDDLVENPESPDKNIDLHNRSKINSSIKDVEGNVSSKANESLSKNVDHLEKTDVVSTTAEEKVKESLEDTHENQELKVNTSDLQDVSLKSEVLGTEQLSESKQKENVSLATSDIEPPSFEELKTDTAKQISNKLDLKSVEELDGSLKPETPSVEQHSESELQERNTSWDTLDIEQPSFEELKAAAAEQTANKYNSSINLEKFHDVSLHAEVLEVEFKPEEQSTSTVTLGVEQPSLEELGTATSEQIANKLDSTIGLEKFHDVPLDAEVLEVEFKPEERSTSSAALDVEQPSLEKLENSTFEQIANKLDSTIGLENFHSVSLDAKVLEDELKPEEQNSSLATLGVEELKTSTSEQITNKLDTTVSLEKSHDVSLHTEVQEIKELKPEQNSSFATLGIEQPSPEELKTSTSEQIINKLDSTINLEKVQNVSLHAEVLEVGELKPEDNNSLVQHTLSVEQPSLDELKTGISVQVSNKSDSSMFDQAIPNAEQYTEFIPQRQSTSLTTLGIIQSDFEELKAAAAEQVANDIYNSSLGLSGDDDCFVTASTDIFQDPTCFDFLINHGNSHTVKQRNESLYLKFDPLASNTQMLPQGKVQPANEEQKDKSESIPAHINTPKRNPAIATIDRLLFYSPFSPNTTQKTDETQESVASKKQSVEETTANTAIIIDINMSKELELLRTSVLQLEEELENRRKDEAEARKLQERVNELEAQLAQEVKNKSQMTIVVEEYEKSISRLLIEREKDRTAFEEEKAKLQEEVQSTNVHLANMEVAFSDLHQKYEKMKGVVSAYKNNEAVLKEGIQENLETIKALEMRYEQLKNHAMSQLEKANYELEAMRKQHEDETVTLHAMVRKAELKSNSLAELVQQKTKENKELAQILDEVIARVGHQNPE